MRDTGPIRNVEEAIRVTGLMCGADAADLEALASELNLYEQELLQLLLQGAGAALALLRRPLVLREPPGYIAAIVGGAADLVSFKPRPTPKEALY